MSSEKLSSAKSLLKGNLGGSWSILDGCDGNYTDLGVSRRFGDAAAAYSLRDIGAMNGRVVRVRREPYDTTAAIDDEAEFSANQVQSGALEDWVNGKLEDTLPADVATAAAAFSLRKVKADYSGNAVQIRRSSDEAEVDVAFDSEGKVSNSSLVTDVTEESESGGTQVASSGATTLGDFINGTDAFVVTWYDQAGSNNAVQLTSASQPQIASSGSLLADGLDFDGSNDFLQTSSGVSITTSNDLSFSIVYKPDVTNADMTLLSQEDGTGTGRSWYRLETDADISTLIGGSSKVFFAAGENTSEKLSTVIFDDSASTIDGFKNSVTGTQGTSVNMEAASGEINIGRK